MSRSRPLPFVAVCVWCPALTFAAASSPAETPHVRPNVLFISIDDLNCWTGALGGHPGAKTPHLDRLSQKGVGFARAYCSAPHCNPSRASLLSGLLPSTSGVYAADDPFRAALPNAVTIPQYFMAQGYRVVGAGKIFHRPERQSWHEFFAPPRDPGPPGAQRPLNGIPQAGYFDWGPLDVDDAQMADGRVAEWGIQQLRQMTDRPFFLGLGFSKPHLPWFVPRRYFDLHPLDAVTLPVVNEHDLDDVPAAGRRFAIDGVGFVAVPGGDHANVLRYRQWARGVQGYLAACSFVDAQVGRVLAALEASPHAPNTIVMVWGDHGWHLGEKLHWRKHALWEEANRCALFVAAPGVAKAGALCERPVSLLDLYPTLIELCGLPPRSELDGHSLVPLLKDPQTARDDPSLTTYGWGNHSVRTQRWRYIRYADGSEELYDHQKDDLEWTNLAADPDFQGIKRDLARLLPHKNAPPMPKSGRASAE